VEKRKSQEIRLLMEKYSRCCRQEWIKVKWGIKFLKQCLNKNLRSSNIIDQLDRTRSKGQSTTQLIMRKDQNQQLYMWTEPIFNVKLHKKSQWRIKLWSKSQITLRCLNTLLEKRSKNEPKLNNQEES